MRCSNTTAPEFKQFLPDPACSLQFSGSLRVRLQIERFFNRCGADKTPTGCHHVAPCPQKFNFNPKSTPSKNSLALVLENHDFGKRHEATAQNRQISRPLSKKNVQRINPKQGYNSTVSSLTKKLDLSILYLEGSPKMEFSRVQLFLRGL